LLEEGIDPGAAASHDAFDVKEGEEYHAVADHSPYGGADGLEVAVTGLSMNSPSHKLAGERGWTPISFYGGSQVELAIVLERLAAPDLLHDLEPLDQPGCASERSPGWPRSTASFSQEPAPTPRKYRSSRSCEV
jgi:hypothetical protein